MVTGAEYEVTTGDSAKDILIGEPHVGSGPASPRPPGEPRWDKSIDPKPFMRGPDMTHDCIGPSTED
jgi:hypothetical protein